MTMIDSTAVIPGEGMRPDPLFEMLSREGKGLTYDDILLLTQPDFSDAPPTEPDITSMFSRRVGLRVPFVSSPMDKVTESRMGIAMAELGGLGIIHYVMPIDEQRDEVRRVKHHVNGRIKHPITFAGSNTIGDVNTECDDRGFRFRTFPVTDNEGRLAGLVTDRELGFAETQETTLSQLMIKRDRVRTASGDTTLEQAYDIMQAERITTLPLVDEEDRVIGMYLYDDVERIHKDHGTFNTDDQGRLLIGAAISTGEDAVERASALADYTDVIVVDTANGDSYFARRTFERVKEAIPDTVDIVMGNITSPRSALLYAQMGADGIRGGQGPGSICSTRRETGIGRAQLTSIYWMARTLRENGFRNIPVCADGGIKYHGDPPKALAIGASSAMIGRGFAGTDESPGAIVVDPKTNQRWKEYRGMGARDTLLENKEAQERYRALGAGVILPQGESGLVPYDGPLKTVLGEYVAGLVACLGYTKDPSLQHLRDSVLLEQISQAGLAESHPHSVRFS